jgi:transporter family-2 protein
MFTTIMVVLAGLLGGVCVGLQGPIAGAMGQRVGGFASSLIVHLGGAILSGAILVAIGGEQIREWRGLPWYMIGAGVFGVILYQTINLTLPRLGSTMMVMLIIVGQLVTGVLIDHFGWLGLTARPVDLPRLAGIALLLAGGYLISR